MASTPSQPGLTVLRIKRKRNEEHLGGLLIDLPRKKQRDSRVSPRPGLFRYVGTVEEENYLLNPMNAQSLKNKVSTDSNIIKSRDDVSPVSPRTGESLRYRLVRVAGNDPGFEDIAGPTQSREVFAESEQEPLTVYDGVHLSPTGISEPSDDPESDMACFSEMVRDYLSVHAPEVAPLTAVKDRKEIPPPSETSFVYDLFCYYQSTSYAFQDPSCSNVGLIEVQPGEDIPFISPSGMEADEEESYEDPDSNDEDNPANDYPDEEKDDASTSDPDWDLLDDSTCEDQDDYCNF